MLAKNESLYPIYKKDELYSYVLWESCVRQGWKIHITLLLENYEEILEIVTTILNIKKVSYKYIYDLNKVKFFLSGDAPYSQLGKIIVIYPDTDEIFLDVIKILEIKLSNFEGPRIISDEQYKDTIIYYRYGVFEEYGLPYLIHKNSIYLDEREYYSVPDFVSPILSSEERFKRIWQDIHPISILHTSSSGNVYEVLKEDKEYVLKEARNLVLVHGGTAIEEIQNEENILKFLDDKDINSPHYFESFFENKNYYILCEKVNGVTLDYYCSSLEPDKLKSVFINLINLVKNHHNFGIILHDISPKNIMVDKNNELFFIDYGFSYSYICENSIQHNSGFTRSFTDNSVHNFNSLEQDYHKLGYLLLNCIFPITYYNEFDRTGNTTLRIFKDYCESNGLIGYYKIAYSLIREPNQSKDNILDMLVDTDVTDILQNCINPSFDSDSLNEILCIYKQSMTFEKHVVDDILFPNFDYIYDKQYCSMIVDCLNFPDKYGYNVLYMEFHDSTLTYSQLALFLALISEYHSDINIQNTIFERLILLVSSEKLSTNSLIDGRLGKCYFLLLMYKKFNIKEYLDLSIKEFLEVDATIICDEEGVFFFNDNEQKISSPYLSSGLAGYLFLFYKLQKVKPFLDDKLLNKIKRSLDTLSREKWYKNGGFLDGGLGISFILILFYRTYGFKNYKESALEILNNSIKMDIFDDNIYTSVNPILGIEDFGMKYGIMGKIFVIDKIITILGEQ